MTKKIKTPVPKNYFRTKLMKRKHSLRKAINDMCKSCIYDPENIGAGTWRKQVEDCPCVDCPLYPVRPVSTTYDKVQNNR